MKINYLFYAVLITLSVGLTSCKENNKEQSIDSDTIEIEKELDIDTDEMSNSNLDNLGINSSKDYNNTDEDMSMDLKNNDLKSNTSIDVLNVAGSSKDFSTLITAAKAVNLAGLLNADDNFTVFAPTNAAFNRLPTGTVDNLLKPENKTNLEKILRYHVFMGDVKASDLINNIKKNNNNFIITSAMGDTFSASLEGDSVILTDAKGNKSRVIKADTNAKNGVVHAINRVMMPKLPQ